MENFLQFTTAPLRDMRYVLVLMTEKYVVCQSCILFDLRTPFPFTGLNLCNCSSVVSF